MLGLLIANAHAQEAAQAAQAQPNIFTSMMPLIIVFVIFYVLMIRPQKKRADQERQFINSLQKGTEVYTKAGVIGTITALTEKVVTLEVENGGKLKVLRSQVGGPLDEIFKKANAGAAVAKKA